MDRGELLVNVTSQPNSLTLTLTQARCMAQLHGHAWSTCTLLCPLPTQNLQLFCQTVVAHLIGKQQDAKANR